MSGLICRCGNRLTNILVPNDVEYLVYTDFETVEMFDEYLDKMCLKYKDCSDKSISDIITEIFDYRPRPERSVWRCPQCKRIYVFENGFLGRPDRIYKLEEEFLEN